MILFCITYMRTATVRDLRNQFARLSRWIEEGESVEITKGGQRFAMLTPIRPRKPKTSKVPDFMARLKGYMPDPLPAGTGQGVIDYDRGDR